MSITCWITVDFGNDVFLFDLGLSLTVIDVCFRAKSIDQGAELVPLFEKHKIAGDVLIGADLTNLSEALQLRSPIRRLLKPELEKLRTGIKGT